ncbi:unnamed protein product [Hymenolepis diminuta]|uniref:Uncharacterized protein n=1 Tax=Hymenolepis diminuta TaxID=6216 RepID=A0A564ZBN7_HYMDI|nr:unnamed protein product [Hymenolepis diminuta]
MTHNPYLPCLNAPIDFPLSHNCQVSLKKHICIHVLAHPYPNNNNAAPTLPAHLLSFSECSSLYLSLIRFNPRCGFLEYIFGLLNSWCSVSQLLLVLTQTATN